jgi:hypothetical protein
MYRVTKVTSTGRCDGALESCHQQLRDSLLARLSDDLERGLRSSPAVVAGAAGQPFPERPGVLRDELDEAAVGTFTGPQLPPVTTRTLWVEDLAARFSALSINPEAPPPD